MSDEIYGLNTSPDEAAAIMQRFIRKDWIEMEPGLYRAKWFDYRFLNPVQATYAYAHEYVRFYKQAYAKNYDSIRAEHVKPLDIENLFQEPASPSRIAGETDQQWERRQVEHTRKIKRHKKRISGIWRGRMFADAMSMPYAEYLEFAFHWTMRYWKQPYLPRPEQLYTDLVIDRAATAWEERSGAQLYFSELPQYKNGVYAAMMQQLQDPRYDGKALQSQNAHHEWLLNQMWSRHDRPDLFAKLIWEDQVLPEDKVRERLGEEVFAMVAAHADSFPNAQRYN